jgi:hypothetical protein
MPRRHVEEVNVFHSFLTLTPDGGEWSSSRPNRFTPGENASSNHSIEGWVGRRACLDVLEKRKVSCPCWDSNPGLFSP